MYIIADETDIFHFIEVGRYRTLDELKIAYRELKEKNPHSIFKTYEIEFISESEEK